MDRLLTPEEVAKLLGVKLSTIYQWTHRGFIPHAKLGRFVRFDPAVIKEWVEKRSVAGRLTQSLDVRQYGI